MKSKIILLITAFVMTACVQSNYAQFNTTVTAAIDSADSLSAVVDLGTHKLAAVIFPSTITAASFVILTAKDTAAASFKVVQYDGTDLSITGSDGKQNGLKPVEVNQLLRYIKIRGASAEADSRIITFVLTNF